MPPKSNYSKEDILNSCINLIRKKGEKYLTARNIAKELGGSTQPIYSKYANIEALVSEVADYACQKAFDIILGFDDPHSHFLSIGLGYYEYAVNEPNLFKFIFMSGKGEMFFDEDKVILSKAVKKMKRDMVLKEMNFDDLVHLFKNMALYSHGICAALNSTQKLRYKEKYRKMIEQVGFEMILYKILEKKGIIKQKLDEWGWENENCSN